MKSPLLTTLTLFAATAVCQDKPLIVSEHFLPTLSHTQQVSIASPKTYPSENLKWFATVEHWDDTDYLRLHVRVNEIPDNPEWSLHIIGGNGREVQILTSKDFSHESHYFEVWSKKISGKSALLELLATGSIDGFQVSIDRYNYQVAEPSEKAFVGRDDRQDLVLSFGRDHVFYKWGIPVASILFVSAQEKKESGCTAFLISRDLLMTNQHCVNQAWQVPTVQVIFGYESNPQKVEQFSITELVLQSQPLDYAILRLNREAQAWSQVSSDSLAVSKDEKLILIQAPPSVRKTIAVHKCKVQSVGARGISNELTDFYHLCDSEGGSSGSPVMDLSTGKVVGLHHAGQYDPSSREYHNLGVHIHLIMADIASQKPGVCQEIAGCRLN
jgi:hypothetical protein